MLKFSGSAHFRQRIVCSTLSGRPVKIDNIRTSTQNDNNNNNRYTNSSSNQPVVGLSDFEASFLRLIEKITNGCEIIINETGKTFGYNYYYFYYSSSFFLLSSVWLLFLYG